MVERDLAKVEVAGSSPVIRSNKKTHPHSGVCFFAVASYGGENPLRGKAARRGKFSALRSK